MFLFAVIIGEQANVNCLQHASSEVDLESQKYLKIMFSLLQPKNRNEIEKSKLKSRWH